MLYDGQKLTQFRIIRRLGAGGMGEVYLAEDEKLRRRIALKILKSEFFDDTERRERFFREARTAAGISHPNVTNIHDIKTITDPDTGKELNFIVMEYVEGQGMSTYFDRSGRDISSIVKIAEKIASGMAAAHKMNIVHRDIKAENILIDQNDEPRILDFGLAKPISPIQMGDDDITDDISQNLTKAGKIIGTVSYMSPEQVRGETIDHRSDIFSFGILLYRISTGDAPFQGDTQVSTLAKILETQPEPPHLRNQDIPFELERIIDKCLQKNPEDRYQDTRDLVVDLRNLHRQYESSISGPTSTITDLRRSAGKKSSKSNLRFITVSILITIVAIISLAIITEKAESPGGLTIQAGENALAILGFENKTGNPEFDWLQTGLPEILLTDLTQAQSISIISRDRVLDCLHGQGIDVTSPALSHPECLRAANELGARHALSGSFYKMGEDIRIDARLEEIATGKIILAEKVIGSNPFVLVDSLTDKIANLLDLGVESISGTDVATYTSSSPEAYKKYLEGMKKFELELYDNAIEDFQAAIQLDSTFALPYMRIALAHTFEGRQQESAYWFSMAQKYEDRLPLRERNILDLYADTWQKRDLDAAFIKMKTFIKNYPDDKEARTIYALMLAFFTQDTAAAYAQFDTALMLDPQYTLALDQYALMLRNNGKYDQAFEYAERALKYHPESPVPYLYLASIHNRKKEHDKAIERYKELLAIYPDYLDAASLINNTYIRLRDFKNAREYLELIPKYASDNPYEMVNYYDDLANLATWEGKFITELDHRHRALAECLKTNDSNLISTYYYSIADYYRYYNMPDSALYYSRQSYDWATFLQDVDYPLNMVMVDPANEPEARPLLNKALENMRASLPSELWPMAQSLQDMFDGFAASDTNKIIDGSLSLFNLQPNAHSLQRQAARFLALSGRYEVAIENFENIIYSDNPPTSGYAYPICLYYLGVSYDELGQKEKAAGFFKEMLGYWGSPELELKEIKDARIRLSRITS